MEKIKQIREAIREIVGDQSNLPISAKVKSVEGLTCTVVLESGLEIPEVRLKPTSDGDNFSVLIPKLESTVTLLSTTGDIDDLLVIMINEVEKIHYKQGSIECLIDSDNNEITVKNGEVNISCDQNKIAVKNNNISLIDLFQMLNDTIKNLTVSTGTGPSGTPLPPTISQLQQFETKFKQLLK